MDQTRQPGTTTMLSRLAVTVAVGSLYVAACASPAIDYKPPQNRDFGDITPYGVVLGIVTLLVGWMNPSLIIPWSANPMLLAGWILLLCKRTAIGLGFGLAATLAGLSTWVFIDEQMQLLLGYYLWQGSLVAFALGALGIWLWEPRKEKTIVQPIRPNQSHQTGGA
jgi:hypothetical protein